MAIIPKDEEANLRAGRKTLHAIKEALQHPQPVAEPAKYVSPPSERFDPAERLEFLQRARDELLFECAKLLRIVHAVIDGTDVRRDNSRKGGTARTEEVASRNTNWKDLAGVIRNKNPEASVSEVARKIKRLLPGKESLETIRKVIKK